MKKIYTLAITLAASISIHAQIKTIDFEELNLPGANSFYNGSDLAGGFSSKGVHFEIDYNADWQSWMGYSYSNVQDATTPGFGNQYASFAGSGANQSANYAVFYNQGKITFESAVTLHSLQVTNTTYTGLVMRDGDPYAKQFGSIYDAWGNLDGTNGEDFLKLNIYAYNDLQQIKDSLTFYLADYRFANDADDYIVSTWEQIDLSPLGAVTGLSFTIESSDMGEFGMNTPGYFALDDLVFESILSTPKVAVLAVQAYPNPVNDVLTIQGESGELQILDQLGRILFTQDHTGFSTIDFSAYPAGVYLVNLSNGTNSGTVKITK